MTRTDPRTTGPPLRIAMVSEHASPLAALGGVDAGGQNVHVARLATALAARGHRVTVYTRRDAPAGRLPDEVPAGPGVTVRHVPAGPPEPLPKDLLLPHMPEFARFLAEQWARDGAEGRPDLLHTHFWMSGVAALHALGSAPPDARRIPLCHTYHALGTVKRRHQGSADTSPRARIALERRIGERCDLVIATCEDEVRELTAMGIPAERTTVVPCGVDPDTFRPDDPGDPGPGDSRSGSRPRPRSRSRHPFRLLHLGRLVPRKGAAVSIAALARLPGTELVIAGGPPPEKLDSDPEVRRLRETARRAGVARRVVFTGAVPRDAVPALLRGADVVLCPADYEPFGIVPLEAMSCGRPVVASAVGGQLDTVTDPGTGRLVPPGDPAALAAAVAALLADPAARAACGAAGRRRVLARYGWDRVAAATEAAYRAALAPARAPAAGRAPAPAAAP
ncbi:glycosyltransferase [Streptomyces aidingensis]|uniref:D-inositol 3-phosphate glycosyltransferase n=1 Tax=Streptomyces aidingensis TaxID=910347 RepID=A0A1I1LAF8_9ACTN|nr:glycosyltransferase [Streptomyces aidingensis]SFC69502.1 Glycosyltransferase involved in cell wall bisynthesis [Streptomyces aidingensis]